MAVKKKSLKRKLLEVLKKNIVFLQMYLMLFGKYQQEGLLLMVL